MARTNRQWPDLKLYTVIQGNTHLSASNGMIRDILFYVPVFTHVTIFNQRRIYHMKKTTMLRISTILAGTLLTATLALAATGYSAMTNEEMAAKRGTMQQARMEERNAFQNERQKRVQQMSPEEKQKAMRQPENGPRDGSGRKSGQGMGSGMGNGSGMGSGSGMGGGMGQGGMGGGGRR